MMTPMTASLEEWPVELDSVVIAQRLRMYMGDKKLSRKELALASGIGRTTLGAKLDGYGAFTLAEINAIARAIDRSWVWVVTGQDVRHPRGGRPVSEKEARRPVSQKRRKPPDQPTGCPVDDDLAAVA
jgi:transcriptional regulator with XRE-family HTH domain